MVEALTNALLNHQFKPQQSLLRKACDKHECKKCKCSKYSSNIVAIFTYLPIKLTRIAASIMTSETIPFFAFSNGRLDLRSAGFANAFNRNPYMRSSFELAAFYLIDVIDRLNIKNLALVNIGTFATDLALYHQDALWNKIVTNRQACIQKKNIGSTDIIEMKRYIDYIRGDKSLQLMFYGAM